METLCKLCRSNEATPKSHIIPAFVTRSIKRASPTGYLRSPYSPNVRVQDGYSMPLMCGICEQRFCRAERSFANTVFHPFCQDDHDTFDYGPWLHYFMTSLSWRTLVLDIPTMGEATVELQDIARNACERDRKYLLGDEAAGDDIEQHLVLFGGPLAEVLKTGEDLIRTGPHVSLRCTASGYVTWSNSLGSLAVVHNLAGVFCARLIARSPHEEWENSEIRSSGGKFAPPQRIKSWLVDVVTQDLADDMRRLRDSISDDQRSAINASAASRPTAAAHRFHRADEQIKNERRN